MNIKSFSADFGNNTTQINNFNNNPKSVDGKQLNIVWEGSQFVYHSLALVNREICKNIANSGIANLTIVPYEPDTINPDTIPDFKPLKDNDIRFKADVKQEIEDLPYVWIRHQWPPKNEPPQGSKWILMQPWEFSKLDDRFVPIFNNADEIWTPSNFSRNAFINSGIDGNKIQVMPNGINPQLFKPFGDKYPLKTQKKFKFLYVGGTIFRKGIDILIRAYTKAFTNNDDVCLVIKDMLGTTAYKGQTMEDKIRMLQNEPSAPEIEYLNNEMNEEEIASLYRSCDMFVSTYRGEGFSLPTLEAMASGLPVIVTRGGSTDDFTMDENAWYINSTPFIINASDLQTKDNDMCLLEPDFDEVVDTLLYVVNNSANNFSQGLIGSYMARKHWTWKNATLKMLTRLDYLYGTEMAKNAVDTLTDIEDDYVILGEAELNFVNENFDVAEQLYILATEREQLDAIHIVHIFNRLAQISMLKDNYVDAYKYVEASFTLNPENPDTLWLKTNMFAAEGKYVEALETINPVVGSWNNEAKYNSNLGITLEQFILLQADILYLMEDIEASFQIYEYALKVNNYSPDACFGLGKCFKVADMIPEAKEMFEFAVKYNPEHTLAVQELDAM
jgi:glycosyltransferase involved in cell wall biosynthesis